MPEVGQLIHNKYRLVRLIGDGGMGSVYEAHHEVLGTSVALKFLHPELARRSGLVQRFLQEARVSARIQSPHVVRVTDVDQTTEGSAFIVMEYIQGKSLQTMYEDLYREGKRMSCDEGLDYALQMMEGLEAAHAEGVVHRDLKPDNVMITKNRKGIRVLKVLDFGIAKLKVEGDLGKKGLTRPGVVMGTPEYMAPEQAFSADAVDARADIFSLGVMIFEMLAGRRPVGGDEAHQIAAQYLTGQVSKLSDLMPDLPEGLCVAVHKAMSANKESRFDSVAEFREAIEPFAESVLKPKPAGATPGSSSAGAAVAQSAPGTPAPASPVPAASPAKASTPPGLVTPATNVPAVEPASELPPRVAKTLPPDDESGVPPPAEDSRPSNGGRMGIVAPSIPPGYDATAEGLGYPSHPLIPVGDATEEQEPIDALARHQAQDKPKAKKTGTEIMKLPDGPNAAAAKGDTPEPGASPVAASLGAMPATRTAAPLEDALLAGPQRTEEGAPIAAAAAGGTARGDMQANGFGATMPADVMARGFDAGATEPFEPPARPGGTAVGEPMEAGPIEMQTEMQAGVAAQSAAQPPMVAPAHASPRTPQRAAAKKAGGLSIFAILLVATGIAGAVTGGVYIASEYGGETSGESDELETSDTKKKKKSKKKKTPKPSEPTQLAGDPTTSPPEPTVDDPATATTEPPPPPPPPPPPTKPTTTTKPPPTKPTTKPTTTTKPPPSSPPPIFTIPILPSGPPILPSALPNLLPGLGRLPGPRKPAPPPAPPATTVPRPRKPPPPPPPPTKKRKPPRIVIPGRSTQIDPGTLDRGSRRFPVPGIFKGSRRRSAGNAG